MRDQLEIDFDFDVASYVAGPARVVALGLVGHMGSRGRSRGCRRPMLGTHAGDATGARQAHVAFRLAA